MIPLGAMFDRTQLISTETCVKGRTLVETNVQLGVLGENSPPKALCQGTGQGWRRGKSSLMLDEAFEVRRFYYTLVTAILPALLTSPYHVCGLALGS